VTDINKLKEELTRLRRERAAFQTQSKLLENFVALARSSEKEKMLPTILQTTL